MTPMVHVWFDVKETFAKLMLPLPAVAVTLEAMQEEPEPVTVRPLGVATTSPPGRVSVKFTPLFPEATPPPVTTNVSVVLLPTEIDAAPNDLDIVGIPCADAGLAKKNTISTLATAAHTKARQRTNVCTAVAAASALACFSRTKYTAPGRKP